MADDVILEVGVVVDTSQVDPGLNQLVAKTQAASTAASQSVVAGTATTTAATTTAMSTMASNTTAAFTKMSSGGIFAMDELGTRWIEATKEVGALKAELESIQDPLAKAKLAERLDEAQRHLSAVRTEMRGLNLATHDATEKLGLLGEGLGVKIPAALDKMLARLPGVQSAMAAAFEVGVVLFFINAIEEGIEKLIEITQELGGFGKAAKEAYQEAIVQNDKLILKNIELHKHLADTGVIGKEGLVKLTAEAKNSEENFAELSARSAQIQQALRNVNVEAEKLKSGVHFTIFGMEKTEAGWRNYKEAVDEAEKSQKRLNDEAKEITSILQFEKPVEDAKEAADRKKELLERSIADQEAATEAEKAIQTGFVDFYIDGLKRELAAGKISFDAEVDGEKAAVEAKAEIDRKYFEEREAELRRRAAIGENVEPQLEALAAKRIESETRTQQQILDIDARADRERVAHANSVSLALAEASKSTVDLQVKAAEEASSRELAIHKITIAQDTENRVTEMKKQLAADEDLARERLRIAQQDVYKNAAEIVTLNALITNLKKEQADREVAIRADGVRRQAEEDHRLVEEERRFATEIANSQLEGMRRADEERLKHNQITLSEWETNERSALGRWYTEQKTVMQQAAEEAARDFGVMSLQYRKALNDMALLDEKFAAENQKIDDKMAEQFQNTMNVISRSFTSAFDKMLTEHTKFSRVMANFWEEMVRGWARMGLQMVANYVQTMAKILIEHILTSLKIISVDQTTQTVRKANESFFDAFLNALGIKRVTQEATVSAAETGAHATGVAARAAASQGETISVITGQAVQKGAVIAGEAAQTGAVQTGEAAQTAAVVAGQEAQTAAVTEATSEQTSTTIAMHIKSIVSAAAVAAAHAFKWVIENVPFPVNVVLAPTVAAGVFAGVAAYKTFVSAEKGAAISHDTMLLAHAGEMVLPPKISLGLQSIINTGEGPAGTGRGFPGVNVPAALAAATPTANQTISNTSTTTSKTFHVAPSITVNNSGGGKHSLEDISDAVHVGIRRGLIKLRGA